SHKGEIRNTLLPLSEVAYYQFSYYPNSEVLNRKVNRHKNFKPWRIALNGGYSYLTAPLSENIPSDFESYSKGLKSGHHLGADISYYFMEYLGLGVKYLHFNSSATFDGEIFLEDMQGNRITGKMSDDINISFFGPTLSTRFFNTNKKNAFVLNFALGYMEYNNNSVLVDNFTMEGGTVGLVYDVGYDMSISKNLLLGFQLSLISGVLKEYQVKDGINTTNVALSKKEAEGLGRIDLSVGLRFSK
ncbi:hypothetical protein, partial [Xanthovirga aplysinae]|uniref:hypothetical protein n=1 Tax=Xanthovirga aplysinae TaxID=2529853 RepID=UPI00165695FA